MPRIQTPPVPGAILSDGLKRLVRFQRNRIATLQEIVDRLGEKVAGSIAFAQPQEAILSMTHYDERWFKKQPYSRRVKAQIAHNLIIAAQPYPYVDTTLWQKIVEGSK